MGRFASGRDGSRYATDQQSSADPDIDAEPSVDRGAAGAFLNDILELELAGVVRYTHYALLVEGYNRMPFVDWLNARANAALAHARQAGERVTWLGGRPSLRVGDVVPTELHDISDILREARKHESAALRAYRDLLALVRDKDAQLEEYAREMIASQLRNRHQLDKMLRAPRQQLGTAEDIYPGRPGWGCEGLWVCLG